MYLRFVWTTQNMWRQNYSIQKQAVILLGSKSVSFWMNVARDKIYILDTSWFIFHWNRNWIEGDKKSVTKKNGKSQFNVEMVWFVCQFVRLIIIIGLIGKTNPITDWKWQYSKEKVLSWRCASLYLMSIYAGEHKLMYHTTETRVWKINSVSKEEWWKIKIQEHSYWYRR